MAKYVIDIDEALLQAARAALGTATINGTVNTALRQAAGHETSRVTDALDVLADAGLASRDSAWR